jgi:hypothetical protein
LLLAGPTPPCTGNTRVGDCMAGPSLSISILFRLSSRSISRTVPGMNIWMLDLYRPSSFPLNAIAYSPLSSLRRVFYPSKRMRSEGSWRAEASSRWSVYACMLPFPVRDHDFTPHDMALLGNIQLAVTISLDHPWRWQASAHVSWPERYVTFVSPRVL